MNLSYKEGHRVKIKLALVKEVVAMRGAVWYFVRCTFTLFLSELSKILK